MNISESTARKIVISGVPNLDAVAVYLEDFGPGAGKITITCFSECWSSFWGSMGERHTISSFFRKASNNYIAGKLAYQTKDTVVDCEKIEADAKREILKDRRDGGTTKAQARDLWERLGWIDFEAPIEVNADFLSDVYGDEWWCRLPQKPNPQYEYLCKIIQTVKDALAKLEEKESA